MKIGEINLPEDHINLEIHRENDTVAIHVTSYGIAVRSAKLSPLHARKFALMLLDASGIDIKGAEGHVMGGRL